MDDQRTLRDLVIAHCNDYGFDIAEVLSAKDSSLLPFPSLSVIIPYFETGKIFRRVLRHLYAAIGLVMMIDPHWTFEILVIDDGSRIEPAKRYCRRNLPSLNIIRNELNLGRAITRNRGLSQARWELSLFLDSDVMVARDTLLYHLKVHSMVKQIRTKAVSVGLFCLVSKTDSLCRQSVIYSKDVKLNDFRIQCLYKASWIGCEEDRRFIGCRFSPVLETNYFRKWPSTGFLGPWLLTNMVLGGFFIVRTDEAKMVGGFDPAFTGYSFTETSIPTKLIAAYGTYIIPIPQGACVHVDNPSVNITIREKNRLFQDKHRFYFQMYLGQTLKEALRGFGIS